MRLVGQKFTHPLMTILFRVRQPDGTVTFKEVADLLPDDVILTDGPETALDDATAALAREIAKQASER